VDERTAIQTPEPAPPLLTGIVAPPLVRVLAPSPINRRRWQNFKANRRGYWALWIFLTLFILSLFAECIANDKPFLIEYDGHYYFPSLFNYTQATFGVDDELAESSPDYRDPYLQKLIADKGGAIVWPPIRYSYDTHNLDLPTPAPSKPTWMLTEAECRPVVERKGLTGCRDLEYNWLGTDDQGFDLVARMIYGFRVSVLFGLILTIVSSVIGVAAGAVQGYFGGWTDLLFQRFIEIWTSVPELYLLLIIILRAGAGLLRAAGHFVVVLLGVAGRPGAGRIPARTQFRVHPGGARARRHQSGHHVPPPLAERHGGHHDVSSVHPVLVGDDLDRPRFPRFRAAARLGLARRDAQAG